MRDKLADIIDNFFGVDSAYFGVDKYEFADYLMKNNIVVSSPIEYDFCGMPCNFMEDIVDRQYEKGITEFVEKLWDGCPPKCKRMIITRNTTDRIVKEMVGE